MTVGACLPQVLNNCPDAIHLYTHPAPQLFLRTNSDYHRSVENIHSTLNRLARPIGEMERIYSTRQFEQPSSRRLSAFSSAVNIRTILVERFAHRDNTTGNNYAGLSLEQSMRNWQPWLVRMLRVVGRRGLGEEKHYVAKLSPTGVDSFIERA